MAPQKMTKGQRRAMLAAIDTGGRLPAGTSRRVLDSFPQDWIRTDPGTGLRWLTDIGWAALLPLDRFHALKHADPETGSVSGLDYAAGRGLLRDGLIVFRDPAGQLVGATDCWKTNGAPYITTRGRKLVGMPLRAPAFTLRLPVGIWGLWRRAGQPDAPVRITGWPMADGTVRVQLRYWRHWSEFQQDVPVDELRPAPRRVRGGLPVPSRAGGPARAARVRLARTRSSGIRRRFPYLRTTALRGEWSESVEEAAIRESGMNGATAWRSGAYGRPVPRPLVDRSMLPREERTGTARHLGRPGRP
ncbi:hypothetical protein OG413_20625 [Streptomyces sp. NBC_01433]|uniref:hypothetical protein n=1 Tax=Streptomyces sp. NBC_01433 TaxID=2903864 RepID=UPI0022543136|nr:hypothetical protein [Streptomyces sp. NBC_01433]MCX4677680.1 hypothetical protein [Streptomyces sp. NBC_01433]